jgi:hypothetical protein
VAGISLHAGPVRGTWTGDFFTGEMEHLSLCTDFIRGTWRGGIFTGDSERHVREGFGRGGSLSLQRLREGNLEGGLPY